MLGYLLYDFTLTCEVCITLPCDGVLGMTLQQENSCYESMLSI